MEDLAFFSRKLRPLKLERNYAVGDSSHCFEFLGSEGRRTRTYTLLSPALLGRKIPAMMLVQ
ncbi:hypothetical protein LTR53_017845, partial [Teratosphaeriaceae sp. CCFEE 6253]